MAPRSHKWAPWKAPEVTGTGSDLSGVSSLELIDITLLTDVTGQTTEVANLGLAFGEAGLTVRRSDGSDVVTIPWHDIVELSADVQPRRFGGLSTEATLDVQSDRSRHRFVVPHVTPEALSGSLGAMSARYGRGELVSAAARRKAR